MTFSLSLRGRIRPLPFALCSAALLAIQYYVIGRCVLWIEGRRWGSLHYIFSPPRVTASTADQHSDSGLALYLLPLRAIASIADQHFAAGLALFAVMLLSSWALAILAFQRARDAGYSGWFALPAVAPVVIVQVPAILGLAVQSTRHDGDHDAREAAPQEPTALPSDTVLGALAGMGLSIFAVALGGPIFGIYGYSLFLLSPFVIGAVTGFLANRHEDIGVNQTAVAVMFAGILGGLALFAVALEGLVCIVVVGPLIIAVALAGGVLGRAIALFTSPSIAPSLIAVALLPVSFAIERVTSEPVPFATAESIDIAASPRTVWQLLLHMDLSTAPLPLLLRAGVAYPISGDVIGTGVGATRIGIFSTGKAVERVTEWAPERALAFTVLSEPPGMRELSPYPHVHAPHVAGYFHTTGMRFEIEELSPGHVRVIGASAHELRLEPIFYWMPIARVVMHLNKDRVLRWLKETAEHGEVDPRNRLADGVSR